VTIRRPLPFVDWPGGQTVPALGMGTWKMGERPTLRAREIAALRLGIELGMTLIDTAEMYGEGEAERLVGEAIASQRDKVFLVTKVYPHNASRKGIIEACENSLTRLRTDWIDLYLLHWRGSHPLSETVNGFETLRHNGKIRRWGVSNFDIGDIEELFAVAGGKECATDQILYNISHRGPEFDLIPRLSQWQIPVMAYSPIEQGRLQRAAALTEVARRHNASGFQVALAWVLRRPGVIAIPKSGDPDHVQENRASLELQLTDDDLNSLDREFPPPRRKQPLAML
jgi:diketogulonate reductase-like aldo/keto reductase